MVKAWMKELMDVVAAAAVVVAVKVAVVVAVQAAVVVAVKVAVVVAVKVAAVVEDTDIQHLKGPEIKIVIFWQDEQDSNFILIQWRSEYLTSPIFK